MGAVFSFRFWTQGLTDLFLLVVFAFAERALARIAFGIDKVMGGPIRVIDGAPDAVVVVDYDRINDVGAANFLTRVIDNFVERVFGRLSEGLDKTEYVH